MSTRYVAVDWSGSLSRGGSETWLAAVEKGRLVAFEGPLARSAVVELLKAWHSAGIPLISGLDFGFSFPKWFLDDHGCTTALDAWRLAADEGERWLAECRPPFWGRPGRPRPKSAQHRRTETLLPVRPKSVFQIGGAGSVGTGSVRGMPWLLELRAFGFNVWPFDPAQIPFVLEIYPRLLTGSGPKRRLQWRREYLAGLCWPPSKSRKAAVAATEDGFDAAVSALRMWEARAALASLPGARDEVDMAEGRVWSPPASQP